MPQRDFHYGCQQPGINLKRISVRLNGGLDRYTARQRQVDIWVEDGVSVAVVQDRLGIPRGEVGLFVVNGEIVNEDTQPRADSIIDLYPTFGGG